MVINSSLERRRAAKAAEARRAARLHKARRAAEQAIERAALLLAYERPYVYAMPYCSYEEQQAYNRLERAGYLEFAGTMGGRGCFSLTDAGNRRARAILRGQERRARREALGKGWQTGTSKRGAK